MLTPNTNQTDNPNPATVIFTLPIHFQGVDPYQCGALRPGDMLRALSFIYAIKNVAPSRYNLRTLILDNCNNDLRIDQDLFNILTKGTLCNTEFDVMDNSIINADSVVAVHTVDSRFVMAANRVTSPFKIQLTSGYASSPRFLDERVYPYVARMVPPDTLQMAVIAKILQQRGWSYVSVLYSQEIYGITGFRTLRDLINDEGYSCVGFAEALTDMSSKPLIKEALTRLDAVEGVRVIILIVSDNVRNVLESLIEMNLASKYVVIGTDIWGTESHITDDIWDHFLGAITISFRDALYPRFVNWMSKLTYINRQGIPDSWFDEFYQLIHQCQLLDSPNRLEQFYNPCRKNLTISQDQIQDFGVGIRDIAAAYAIGQGLNRFRCSNSDTFAECLATVEDARDLLFESTLAVDWQILENFRLQLGSKRYWDSGYSIYTIKEDNVYEQIGSSQEEFFFNDSYLSYKGDGFSSRCPANQFCDCTFNDEVQQEEIVQEQLSPIAAEPRNYYMYKDSEEGEDPEKLYTWPVWAIAVAVLSLIGILIGLMLFAFFLIAYPVRGGTTVLGFLMMIGVFGIYAINFAFFLPASAATCGARGFVLGVVYAIVFAALLIKAVDNWRFKDADIKTKQYYRGISSPCLLILFALLIILVQCIIPIEWLIVENPSASLMEGAADLHDWMACDPHDFHDISLVLSMIFVIFLVLLTAIFAIMAWDSESNYYESRWILVSCISTAGCFLVWMVVSTNAGPPYRDPAVAIGNFVNATALLVFIPLRKFVLLIQFKYEEDKDKLSDGELETNKDFYSTVFNNEVYEPESPVPNGKSAAYEY